MDNIKKHFRDVAFGKIDELKTNEEKVNFMYENNPRIRFMGENPLHIEEVEAYNRRLSYAKEQYTLYSKYVKDIPRTVTDEQKELIKVFMNDIDKSSWDSEISTTHIGLMEIYAIIDYMNAKG